MKIEYNNIYIHFVFTTMHRQPLIPEKSRIRIEKYITGIVTNHGSKLYAIYANPDHVHFLVSRDPSLSDTKQTIWPPVVLPGNSQLLPFQYQNRKLIKYANTS